VSLATTGARTGTEVAQFYIRDRVGSVTRPVKKLKGFQKLKLEPGEKREISFELAPQDLSFPDATGAMRLEPGEFEVFVGGSSAVAVSVVLQVLP